MLQSSPVCPSCSSLLFCTKYVRVINGYMFENASSLISNLPSFETKIFLEDNVLNTPFYRLHFYGRKHLNYVAVDKEGKGMAIVSLEVPPLTARNTDLKALILTESGYSRNGKNCNFSNILEIFKFF